MIAQESFRSSRIPSTIKINRFIIWKHKKSNMNDIIVCESTCLIVTKLSFCCHVLLTTDAAQGIVHQRIIKAHELSASCKSNDWMKPITIIIVLLLLLLYFSKNVFKYKEVPVVYHLAASKLSHFVTLLTRWDWPNTTLHTELLSDWPVKSWKCVLYFKAFFSEWFS